MKTQIFTILCVLGAQISADAKEAPVNVASGDEGTSWLMGC